MTKESAFRLGEFLKQPLYCTDQFREIADDMVPDKFRRHAVIAVSQMVTEIDEASHVGNSTGCIRMNRMKAFDCFADNLELALDSSLSPFVGGVGHAVHVLCERSDISRRLVDVCQQDAGITPHRQFLGTH